MLWPTVAIVLLILGIITVLWSCFWDRPGRRGRPTSRCRKCWYDLSESGQLPITCPECGKVSKTTRSTTRTRRHKRIALLGLLLILSAPIALLTPQYRQGTLFASAPNWLLIELLPLFPTFKDDGNLYITGNNPGVELITRFARREEYFTNKDAVNFINRVAEGNIFAQPGSRKWQSTSAYWLRTQHRNFGNSDEGWHYPDMTPADQDLLDAIAKLNAVLPMWYPETRDRWPIEKDILIRSDLGNSSWSTKLRNHQEVHWKVRGTNHAGSSLHGGYFAIPNLYLAGEVLTIDLHFKMYRSIAYNITDETKGDPVDEHHAVLKTKIVASIDDVIQRVSSQPINALLIEELIPEIPYSAIHSIVLNNQVFMQPMLHNIGMGLRITLHDASDPIVEYTQKWMCQNGKLNTMSTESIDFVPLEEVDSRVQDAIKSNALRITIKDDHAGLLDNFDIKRAWTGTIDINYNEALNAAESTQSED